MPTNPGSKIYATLSRYSTSGATSWRCWPGSTTWTRRMPRTMLAGGSVRPSSSCCARRARLSDREIVMKCARCDDTYWVCEVHSDVPWGPYLRACECGAPGMPCPGCNGSDPPKMPPGLKVTVDDKRPRQ
jgi:hypothetical protein